MISSRCRRSRPIVVDMHRAMGKKIDTSPASHNSHRGHTTGMSRILKPPWVSLEGLSRIRDCSFLLCVILPFIASYNKTVCTFISTLDSQTRQCSSSNLDRFLGSRKAKLRQLAQLLHEDECQDGVWSRYHVHEVSVHSTSAIIPTFVFHLAVLTSVSTRQASIPSSGSAALLLEDLS